MDPLPKQKPIASHFLTRRMLSYEQGLPLALRLTVHSNSASLVKVTGFTKDAVFSFEMTPVGDLTQQVQTFSLTDFPIWLSIVTDDDTLVRGDVYAKVEMMVRETPHGTLAQGYVYSLGAPSWPNGNQEDSLSGRGKILVITGSNPAVGAEISETVPANVMWHVKAVRLQLVTDVNAANRRPHLVFTDGANNLFDIFGGATQPASLTRNHSFTESGQTPSLIDGNDHVALLPINVLIPTGFQIITQTNAIQAGDDYAAPFLYVEQWILPS